jgi:hypothetical protein
MQIRDQDAVKWIQRLRDLRAEKVSAPWADADAAPTLPKKRMQRIAAKTNGACQSRLPSFGAANERNPCRFSGCMLAWSLH